MRGIPVKRAFERILARRGVKQIALGLSLLLPATAFMARVPEAMGGVGNQNSSTQLGEEQSTANLVGAVWNDQVGASTEADESVASDEVVALAEEYSVPVTMASDIHEAAMSESIDPKIAFGLVRAESRFRPSIVSPVGAIGLTQVMPATAKWLMPGTTKADLTDPATNLKVGFKYLRSLLDQYEGNSKLALTAYNRGPGTVSKILNRGGNPDNGYAEMVMTGKSAKHVRLMNAKFGRKHAPSHVTKKRVTKKHTTRKA